VRRCARPSPRVRNEGVDGAPERGATFALEATLCDVGMIQLPTEPQFLFYGNDGVHFFPRQRLELLLKSVRYGLVEESGLNQSSRIRRAVHVYRPCRGWNLEQERSPCTPRPKGSFQDPEELVKDRRSPISTDQLTVGTRSCLLHLLMWTFSATPRCDALSSRSAPVSVSEHRVEAILSLLPVSRVSDLTPFDPLGLPVFAAITPLARDLTTHLGKGVDKQRARVSALMEAVERVSSENTYGDEQVDASQSSLHDSELHPIDPALFDLPKSTSYAPDRPLRWCAARNLLSGEDCLLPRDLALSPPREGLLASVDTNGLASGNGMLEAVIHALCEVIERDALGQLTFCEMFGRELPARPAAHRVDLASIPEQAALWVERIRSNGLDITIDDITSDVGVATFRAYLSDYAYPGEAGPRPVQFRGCGCAVRSEIALMRAITEAVQSRVGFVQGARDSFNVNPVGQRHENIWRTECPQRPFDETPSSSVDDLLVELDYILERVSRIGCEHVIAVDMTNPQFGIPVVRVRVPGLTAFYVNRQRVGWRCLRWLL